MTGRQYAREGFLTDLKTVKGDGERGIQPHRIYLSGEGVELDGGAFRMALKGYLSSPLWAVLVETVHAMIMYPHHKAFVRDTFLPQRPNVTPQDLAAQMGIPVGESLVILYELRESRKR